MFQKITKKLAKKLYDDGEKIFMMPSLCNDISKCLAVNREIYYSYYGSFEQMSNRFKYYYCNEEDGKYVRYYVDL